MASGFEDFLIELNILAYLLMPLIIVVAITIALLLYRRQVRAVEARHQTIQHTKSEPPPRTIPRPKLEPEKPSQAPQEPPRQIDMTWMVSIYIAVAVGIILWVWIIAQ